VFHNRRFACAILGAWLGAGVSVDLLVTQNFSAVDRFISDPGSPAASAQVGKVGAKNLRVLLRRSAADENASVFQVWEWIQIALAIAFFFLILLGEKPSRSALALIPAMLAIVLLQHFILTPHIISLGSDLDETPAQGMPNNPNVARFWIFHGFYSGFEILKLLIGIGLASRLMIHRERRSDSENPPAKITVKTPIRRRRRTSDRTAG